MIKARKKTGDWQHFFWLTFYSSSLMSNLYISYEKKNKRTDPRIGSRWLAGKSFGWRSERNRCGEAFLTPSVTFGHVCLEGEKKQAKCFYCYSMFHILSTTNIYNYEHFQKKVDIYPQNSLRGHPIMNFALQEILVHAPISSLPFLYSPYLWFLIVA